MSTDPERSDEAKVIPLPDRLRRGIADYHAANDRLGRRAPEERGEMLGVLPTSGGAELRLTWLRERDRPPVFSIRLWAPEGDGQLWPVRNVGCSVAAHKIAVLAEAVLKALELANAQRDQRMRTRGGRR